MRVRIISFLLIVSLLLSSLSIPAIACPPPDCDDCETWNTETKKCDWDCTTGQCCDDDVCVDDCDDCYTCESGSCEWDCSPTQSCCNDTCCDSGNCCIDGNCIPPGDCDVNMQNKTADCSYDAELDAWSWCCCVLDFGHCTTPCKCEEKDREKYFYGGVYEDMEVVEGAHCADNPDCFVTNWRPKRRKGDAVCFTTCQQCCVE